ncbi:hypothetical protein ANANG_G00076060 [Anguilla anguilla]|uniref:Uncharacterized protein n=1 Tax=Anguilla anguilla TaxID=7936 RepID=A0A9D3MNZ6_ANGAN|nr:hypothetical protein ANANG_G00076060 [Anguilla anguilla]
MHERWKTVPINLYRALANKRSRFKSRPKNRNRKSKNFKPIQGKKTQGHILYAGLAALKTEQLNELPLHHCVCSTRARRRVSGLQTSTCLPKM